MGRILRRKLEKKCISSYKARTSKRLGVELESIGIRDQLNKLLLPPR